MGWEASGIGVIIRVSGDDEMRGFLAAAAK